MPQYQQINLFEFGLNDKGEYVNLAERDEDEYEFVSHPYEEIVKGHERERDFCVVATFYEGSVNQYGMTLDEIRKEISCIAKTKCYHFGNMDKGIYAYSYRVDFDDGDRRYWFAIENERHIAIVRHVYSIDDVLTGKELISYPALCVYLFDKAENGAVMKISTGYGNHEKDIRYKILCGEFEILEFSSNRIDEGRKPKDFYEAQFALPDFIRHWEGRNDKDSK